MSNICRLSDTNFPVCLFLFRLLTQIMLLFELPLLVVLLVAPLRGRFEGQANFNYRRQFLRVCVGLGLFSKIHNFRVRCSLFLFGRCRVFCTLLTSSQSELSPVSSSSQSTALKSSACPCFPVPVYKVGVSDTS